MRGHSWPQYLCSLALHFLGGREMRFAGEVLCTRCRKVVGWWR